MTGRLGRYEIRGVLGRGAMGIVYDGWDPQLARRVAIKVVGEGAPPERTILERFEREAQILAGLCHPHIVAVYDIGSTGGVPFIVMEFVPGQSLAAAIASGAPLPVAGKLEIGIQLCDALARAHAHGVIHRDVKPANILVDPEGRARLVDFGVAALQGSVLTRPFDIPGTPAYASPEALRGVRLDARADLYGLAVTLYEWLCGTRPHAAANTAALLLRIRDEDAPDIRQRWPGCPGALAACLRRALDRDPDARFQSAAAFAGEIRAVLQSLAVPGPEAPDANTRTSTAPAPLKHSGHRPNAAAVSVVGLLATLVLAGGLIGIPIGNTGDAEPPARKRGRDVNLAPLPVRQAAVHDPGRLRRALPPSQPQASATSSVADPDDETEESGGSAGPAVAVGTRLLVRIATELRTDRTKAGDSFAAALVAPLANAGVEVAPAGTPLHGVVDLVVAGRPGQAPMLDLSLVEIVLPRGPVPMRSARYRVVPPAGDGDARIDTLIIGAAAGAVLGGAVAKGRGAVAGAAIGAALAEDVSSQASRRYVLGNELTFKLAEALRLPPAR